MKKIFLILIVAFFSGLTIYGAASGRESSGRSSSKKTTKSRTKTTTPKSSSSKSSNLNGHEAVNLGLSVKWAKCNLGASSPFERGEFYRWSDQGDTARKLWGGTWRTPNYNEVMELYRYCRWEWKKCTYSDDRYKYCSYGYLITGPNGNSIFLPANGRKYYSDSINLVEEGFYWTSCYVMEMGIKKPTVLSFSSSRVYFPNYENIYGMGIRPVTN